MLNATEVADFLIGEKSLWRLDQNGVRHLSLNWVTRGRNELVNALVALMPCTVLQNPKTTILVKEKDLLAASQRPRIGQTLGMKPIKAHSISPQAHAPSPPSARVEIVTTLFLKHGGDLLDSSKLSDLVLIADVLRSSDAIQELVRLGQGRDVVALVSRLPRDQQPEVLSSQAVVELINSGCSAAILKLLATWSEAERKTLLGTPVITKAFRERGFCGAVTTLE